MKDRVSLYPGRIRLIPVEGQDNVYDLVRADEPIEEGTPLNKVNLLKDSTIQKYVNANINVPDDVFNYLGNYAEYWWKRSEFKYREKKDTPPSSYTFYYYNSTCYESITVNETTGEITLNGTGTLIKVTSDKTTLINTIKGKYLTKDGYIFYIHNDITTSSINSNSVFVSSAYDNVSAELYYTGEISYVHSTERSAFPDSGDYNGFSYEYVGIPFENMPNIPVKIETGSYVGTGTYGSSNPNSLTFSFKPKLVMFTKFLYSSDSYNYRPGATIFVSAQYDAGPLVFDLSDVGEESISMYINSEQVYCSLIDKTFSYYHKSEQGYQMNSSGYTYHYVAIG